MNLIVAVDNKWGIGRDNRLLASLPGDMKYFREHTMGKVVVMGRKTLESMPGQKGLPGRTNIVLTSDVNYVADGVTVINSAEDLLTELGKYNSDDVFLIGGATLYNEYYNLCNKLYVTKIKADLRADTFITNFDEDDNFVVISESGDNRENGLIYRFLVYERK